MYPRQSPTTHTEQLGDEASVYDWARGQVHALNPTAARVWQQCDGATSPEAMADALARDMVPEARAVVELTLKELTRLQLLELPADSLADQPAKTRRWLLGRGVAAAMLPAIYSIVAPSPVEAQSVGAGAPTLTSLSPNQGSLGTTVTVVLTGSNFVAGATTVNVASGGVTAANVIVSSATSLTVDIVIAATATTGTHSITVTTAAGTSTAQTFTVSAAAAPGTPTLTNVSPNQGVAGSTVAVTLIGSNFIVGSTTVTVGGGGVTVNSVVVSSGTSLTANFVIGAAAAVGADTVTVTTPAGTSGPRIFTVTAPAAGAPTLTSVTPNQGILGTTVAVTLTGTNFVAGATVAISGGGVTVSNVVVSNATSLTADFAIGAGAAAAARSVTVTTGAGTSGAQTFTIDPLPGAGTPTLTSVSPNQGFRGTTVAVTLTGTNFVVGATTVNIVGAAGISVTNVIVGSGTSLTANFVLDPAAAIGSRSVTVTTAGGTSAPRGFSINLPAPTLTSITPNQGGLGSVVAVTLTGTNFIGGTTTVSVSGSGVTVANVNVSSGTSLTASFLVDPAAAVGPRTVTVTTAGGTSGAQTFTVDVPHGSATFTSTGLQLFTVPAGVVAITIDATGARGGNGGFSIIGGSGGLGGRTTATVSVTPGASLAVRVGGVPADFVGGFNGGGGSTGIGGGGGGASDVYQGGTPLVIAGGGGGGGSESGGRGNLNGGNGGGGGGLIGGPGVTVVNGGGGGGGGTQAAGGAGGTVSPLSLSGTAGTAGGAGQGGTGGAHQPGVIGGGGGGGGYFGGGGGGGGDSNNGAGGGGGGSSFAALGATGVVHAAGVGSVPSVTISW